MILGTQQRPGFLERTATTKKQETAVQTAVQYYSCMILYRHPGTNYRIPVEVRAEYRNQECVVVCPDALTGVRLSRNFTFMNIPGVPDIFVFLVRWSGTSEKM